MKSIRTVVIPVEGKVIRGKRTTTLPLDKSSIPRHLKAKVLKDGTPAPDCPTCPKKAKP